MKQLGEELNCAQIMVGFKKEKISYCKFNFQQMIAVADLDKNGKISLEEFTKLVKEPF